MPVQCLSGRKGGAGRQYSTSQRQCQDTGCSGSRSQGTRRVDHWLSFAFRPAFLIATFSLSCPSSHKSSFSFSRKPHLFLFPLLSLWVLLPHCPHPRPTSSATISPALHTTLCLCAYPALTRINFQSQGIPATFLAFFSGWITDG